MRAVSTAWLCLALVACDATIPESAPPPAPLPAPPAAVAATPPRPAAPAAVPPGPEGRAARRQAALELLADGTSAASLPLVDTSPGRDFDWQLAYKLTPKIVTDHLRVPTVRQAKATVVGPLEKDIIRRVVRAHINEIRHCYNQGLAIDPFLKGRIVVDFTILGDGKVGASAITDSSMNDADFDACIEATLRRWRFPKPERGETVTVSYPFVLEPG